MEGLPKDLIELISLHCTSPEDWLAFASTCRAIRYGTQRIRAWFSKAPAIPWVWKALIGCACALDGDLPEFQITPVNCLIKPKRVPVFGTWGQRCMLYANGEISISLFLDTFACGLPSEFSCVNGHTEPRAHYLIRLQGKDFRFCSVRCMETLWMN